MKRILIAVVLAALVFNVATARKKDKAGKVKDGAYTDSKLNFSLKISEAWKYNIKKSNDNIRIVLTKKQYDIPTEFSHAPSYTQVPKVTVLADTTSISLDIFVDSLLSDKYKSDQKKSIVSEFPILYGDYRLKKRTKMSVEGNEGIMITAQMRYTLQVQRAGSQSDKADVVSDFYGGSVFFVKRGNDILMFHYICEWRYFDIYIQEFVHLIEGLKFLGKE
jgi:hypothetical protein